MQTVREEWKAGPNRVQGEVRIYLPDNDIDHVRQCIREHQRRMYG